MYDQGRRDDMMHEVEYRDQRGLAYQAQVRGKEEALIQSALGRIARARAKGKTNVNLSEEEMEALQRRNHPQPEPPLTALASPPPTPAKIPKASSSKTNSRSNSSTNLAGQKTRKRGSTGLFGNGSSSSSPAKSNSKAKVNRKPSAEQPTPPGLPYPMTAAPGVMIPGPDGVPVYAPFPYPPPASPEYRRTNSGGSSQPGSRSGSKHSRRESTPPERTNTNPNLYEQYPMRYYPPSSMRPPSSSSMRSLPDEADWYPPPAAAASRTRSASNAHVHGGAYSYGYGIEEQERDGPGSLPAAQAAQGGSPRRAVSGGTYAPAYSPAYVPAHPSGYASLRRTPAGSSPLAPRPVAAEYTTRPGYANTSFSDPSAISTAGRTNSGLRQQVRDESSESNSSGSGSGGDDQGVQVEILADENGGGYSISRHAAPPLLPPNERATGGSGGSGTVGSGGEGRRRRGGRR